MEDQVAISSPTSSWGAETLGKICDPLSQSSKNDVVVSVQGPCIGRSTPSQTCKCELCSKNVATLFIKPCKHDIFWISCVQGLEECPICDASIIGWGGINKRYTTNPFMSSASLIADAKVKESTKKDSILEHDDPSGGTPAGGGVDEEEGVGYDTDDSTKAVTREWCSDDQFSNGGVRSGQDALEFGNNENKANPGGPNTELEEEVVVKKSQGGKRFATIYDPLVQVEAPASKPQKRSRSGQVAPDMERHI